MRRDDELRALARRPDGDREQRERSTDRKGRLRLVEDVQPVAAEPVGGERQERLTVRLLVQRNVAVEREVRRERRAAVDEARDVEEALRAQEVAVARLARRQDRLQRAVQRRPGNGRQLARALELSAIGREADRLRDRLDDRGLPGAVVAR